MLLPPVPQFIQNIFPGQHETPAWYFGCSAQLVAIIYLFFITLAFEPLITIWREDLVSLGCAFNL